jgi:hypothetical protein
MSRNRSVSLGSDDLSDVMPPPLAFSSEVDTGSRKENASKQKAGALIPSKPE